MYVHACEIRNKQFLCHGGVRVWVYKIQSGSFVVSASVRTINLLMMILFLGACSLVSRSMVYV